MCKYPFSCWVTITAWLFSPIGQVQAQAEIKVADGLLISQVADDELVPDCTAVTVDSMGRVIASGPKYIRVLLDRNEDGRFDHAGSIVDAPGHGAHGLCVDGADLYYVGDGGVWRTTDTDQDGLADSAPIRVLEIKTGGEHDAHALRKGPDGFWYLIAGNGPQEMFALQNVDQPATANPRAGAIWRISPDWARREVWAHGFRNAYDFDFAPDQAIDTFDSDGERDVSLPWYRPTRVFRVKRGDDAGWMTRSWKRPNVDPQMPRVLAQLGRGSPTGVVRYRHRRLPERFRHGVFVLDWTFGRIVFVADNGHTELVAQATGTTGFAVTDIECLPDGRLVVSVGGRRSRGGLYVIDAVDPLVDTAAPPLSERWPGTPIPARSDPTCQRIARLRNQQARAIDHEAAEHAVQILENHDASHSQQIAAMTLLSESVGGLGDGNPKDARGKEQVAAVFDGYRSRLRPKLSPQLIHRAANRLIQIIESAGREHDELVDEAIRTLAVLEPDQLSVFNAIFDELDRAQTPVEKLHRLIALARIPTPRNDDMTERVARAMLEIPVQVHDLGLSVERNWTLRLGELFVAFARRDSLLPSRLISNEQFGHPAHLVWTEQMDPENLERARQKYLLQSRDREIDPAVARFIALGNDAVPRPVIRRWLTDPTTRPAAHLAIVRHPKQTDVDQLQQAALSTDQVVREAATRALGRLGAEIPVRQPTSETIKQWLAGTKEIVSLEGDSQRGKGLFVGRQCAACHGGSKALGPSLEGISKRLSSQDLLRATVDPSHNIPDRYRARRVLTTDDQIIIGMIIYESSDGLTLLTADAKTLRINADAIAQSKASTKSLMPEGLIDGLTQQQAADLLAYMRSL